MARLLASIAERFISIMTSSFSRTWKATASGRHTITRIIVTGMRFIHLEKGISELRDLHEDDMEKNSSSHKDFYREIGGIKERLIGMAARNGLLDRRQSPDGGEAAVNNVLGRHALRGWGIIIAAILSAIGMRILDVITLSSK